MLKLTIDRTTALCQCSIVELAQAVAESMVKEIGADLSNEDYSSKSLQLAEIIDYLQILTLLYYLKIVIYV